MVDGETPAGLDPMGTSAEGGGAAARVPPLAGISAVGVPPLGVIGPPPPIRPPPPADGPTGGTSAEGTGAWPGVGTQAVRAFVYAGWVAWACGAGLRLGLSCCLTINSKRTRRAEQPRTLSKA